MRIRLLAVLLTCYASASAQDGIFGYGLYGSVGYDFNAGPKLFQLESLRQDYNKYFASNLAEPMQPMRFNNAFQWSAGVYFNALDLEVAYSKWKGETFSMSHWGTRREWQIDMFSRQMHFGVTLPLQFLRVGGYIGFDYHKGTFYSRLIYPDGYTSYGMDSRMNGIYNTARMDFTGGFKVMVGYLYGFLYFKADYLGLFSSGEGGELASRFKDELGSGFSFYENYYFPQYYPSDMAGFNNQDRYWLGNGATVDSRIKGWRFYLGATFCLCMYDN